MYFMIFPYLRNINLKVLIGISYTTVNVIFLPEDYNNYHRIKVLSFDNTLKLGIYVFSAC